MLHASEHIYGLVNDVAAYPEFVAHCAQTSVHEQSAEHMRASLTLKKSGVKLQFTTHNKLTPHSSIIMELVDGPFTYLQGEWRFESLRADACKVQLDLVFEMQNSALAKITGGLLESVGNNLVDAFCERANTLYGRNTAFLNTLR
jgi:ribosome-associated toxin RatA of RatAB toxin-antitoxin module